MCRNFSRRILNCNHGGENKNTNVLEKKIVINSALEPGAAVRVVFPPSSSVNERRGVCLRKRAYGKSDFHSILSVPHSLLAVGPPCFHMPGSHRKQHSTKGKGRGRREGHSPLSFATTLTNAQRFYCPSGCLTATTV